VDAPELALAQAAGAPLSALEHAAPGVRAERRAWLDALLQPERISVQGLAARIDAGGRDERKARLARVVDWLIALTADLARVAAAARCGRIRTPPPRSPGSRRGGARRIVSLSSIAVAATRVLAHPLQPRLVVEALLIDYRALF